VPAKLLQRLNRFLDPQPSIDIMGIESIPKVDKIAEGV
jgi:hypothetical protein